MFRNRNRSPEPPDSQQDDAAKDNAPNIEALIDLRTKLFDILENRLGKDTVDDMRADFENHLNSDPQYGAEAGWVCLLGKMIKAMDRLTDALVSAEQGGGGLTRKIREATPGIDGFTHFGKAA